MLIYIYIYMVITYTAIILVGHSIKQTLWMSYYLRDYKKTTLVKCTQFVYSLYNVCQYIIFYELNKSEFNMYFRTFLSS